MGLKNLLGSGGSMISVVVVDKSSFFLIKRNARNLGLKGTWTERKIEIRILPRTPDVFLISCEHHQFEATTDDLGKPKLSIIY